METRSDVIIIFSCPSYGTAEMKFVEKLLSKGNFVFLVYTCQNCYYLHELCRSARSEKGFDLSKVIVCAMHACAQGYTGFCKYIRKL